jgi:eukaryotic-like serine/threonine-protein kinase
VKGGDPLRLWEQPTRTATEGAAQRLAAGALLGGRYRIAGLLGVGGMGMVYRAEDEQLGLTVAVKVLRPDIGQDGQRLERFKQELLLARQVSHPNVVRIHDIGTDDDLVFLTMDFVAGRSLRELLADERRLPPDRAAEIARQLALALEAAHRAGVVHRDLKPANVLVDESAAGLRVAITDFGIARSLAGAGMTVPGTVLGTLVYLSPEQARGDAVDGRSDLYALGLVLYEMLTGELPFSAATEAEMLAQRLTGAPRHLRFAGVAVPPRLSALVQRLLARDPARRPAGAAEVAEELARSAAPPAWRWPAWRRSRWSRWTSWTRTSRAWRLALAAACLLALATLGWTLYQRSRPAPAPPPPAVVAGPRHTVALLPLADETGRPDLAWVATGMPEMLAAALAESPGLRVLDSQRVFQTLADLKLPYGPPSEAEAGRLTTLLDADRLVSGRVHADGGRLRVDLSLLAADLPGVPATALHAEVAAGEAFRLIEQLGERLRGQLAAAAPLAEPATSRSPAALAAYAEGVARLRRGDALAAVPALERAVAADPRFTAAWVRLARAREALGRGGPALQAAQRAVATLGPEESRAAYEARAVEARLLGRPQRAQELLSLLLARYPDDVEARIALAEAYGEQGPLDRANAELQTVVRLAPHHPSAWFVLAKNAINSGNAQRAVDEYLVRALVIQNQLGSEQGRADVLNAFGVAYGDLGDMERAAEHYRQAAELRRRIGDDRGYASTLRNLANIHISRGEYAAAEAQLREAQALLEPLGDAAGIADVLNDFGVLAEQQGRYEKALEHFQRALRARRDLGDDLALAESYSNVGISYYVLGRYDDALVYLRQGLDLAQKSAGPGGVVLATQDLGLLQLARGDWDQAVKSFLAALQSSRALGMKDATAASLGHLGRLAQYQGRFGAALASYSEALKVLRELGNQRGLAEFTLAAAEAELELGQTAAAGRRLAAAEELLRAGANEEQQSELDRLRGELHLALGEHGAAAGALRRAVAAAEESHGVVAVLAARLSAAEAGVGTGGKAGGKAEGKAEGRAGGQGGGRAGRRAGELAALRAEIEALGNARLRLRAAEAVARAALAEGDPARAQAAAREGLALAAACGGSAGAYRLHRLLASALEREGGAEAAAEAAFERQRAAAEIARISRGLKPAERPPFVRIVEAQG